MKIQQHDRVFPAKNTEADWKKDIINYQYQLPGN